MLTIALVAPDIDALDGARAYLEIDDGVAVPGLAALIAAAIERCEAATGQLLIVRDVAETVAATGGWVVLGASPVVGIVGVGVLGSDGVEAACPVERYTIDISPDGSGMVRVAGTNTLAGGTRERVRVRYRAGVASGWAGLPAAWRQGILRLVAHWHLYRHAETMPAVPSAVAVMWGAKRRLA